MPGMMKRFLEYFADIYRICYVTAFFSVELVVEYAALITNRCVA